MAPAAFLTVCLAYFRFFTNAEKITIRSESADTRGVRLQGITARNEADWSEAWGPLYASI
jgi:hypothetical protein